MSRPAKLSQKPSDTVSIEGLTSWIYTAKMARNSSPRLHGVYTKENGLGHIDLTH